MPLDKVGFNEISEYVQLLSRLKKSPTTIQQHIVATRKVLNYAYANNYIKHLPKFPAVKLNSVPRGSFNLSEYKLLVQTAKRYVHTKIVDPTKSQRKRGRFHMDAYLTISPELVDTLYGQWIHASQRHQVLAASARDGAQSQAHLLATEPPRDQEARQAQPYLATSL